METRAYVETRRGWRRGEGKRRTWRGCAFIIVSSRKYSLSRRFSYLVAGVSASFAFLFPFFFFPSLLLKHLGARSDNRCLSFLPFQSSSIDSFPIRLKRTHCSSSLLFNRFHRNQNRCISKETRKKVKRIIESFDPKENTK